MRARYESNLYFHSYQTDILLSSAAPLHMLWIISKAIHFPLKAGPRSGFCCSNLSKFFCFLFYLQFYRWDITRLYALLLTWLYFPVQFLPFNKYFRWFILLWETRDDISPTGASLCNEPETCLYTETITN